MDEQNILYSSKNPQAGNLRMYEKKISAQERKIYDLTNLISLGMSLASNLNIESLVESILFSCMGQMFCDKVAVLLQADIDEANFVIYMDKGYDEPFQKNKPILTEDSPLVHYFEHFPEPHLYADLMADKKINKECEKISILTPELIVPMKSKDIINGLIILSNRLTGEPYGPEDRDFLADLAKFAAIAVENSRLYLMATLDRMTRLYIHHYFHERLLEFMKRSKRNESSLALLMIDIDHFKNVNDTYGHQQGDIIIKEVAKIIKRNIRSIDIPARYGGEEFAVILPEINLSEAALVAERLRKNINDHVFNIKESPIQVTVSIGCAQFDSERDQEKKDFIERADSALYKAKNGGRNRVVSL